MREESILQSFQATGVWPMEADAVLKRFKTTTPEQAEAAEISQHGDGDSWRELRRVFNAAVDDKSTIPAQQLDYAVHSLQMQNELLHHENEGLIQALSARKKRKKHSHTLDLQQRHEYHGGAVFWSPRKLREAQARKATTDDEKQQLQLQKTRNKEAKAAHRLYQKNQAAAAKAARQRAAEEKRQAKKIRADELADPYKPSSPRGH